MLRKSLFNIIRQEKREIEDALEKEERSIHPDRRRMATLRQEVLSLGRELEHYTGV